MAGIRRVVRYLLSGTGSLGLDLALQWVFLALLGWPVWLGTIASYEVGLVGHFVAVHWWVFGHRAHSWRRFFEFHGAALAAEVTTLAVTNALVYGPSAPYFATGIGPYAAKVIGTGAAFLLVFLSSFFWIWRPGRGLAPAVLEPERG